MAAEERRRRVAALNFLTNISLDGTHRDTKYGRITNTVVAPCAADRRGNAGGNIAYTRETTIVSAPGSANLKNTLSNGLQLTAGESYNISSSPLPGSVLLAESVAEEEENEEILEVDALERDRKSTVSAQSTGGEDRLVERRRNTDSQSSLLRDRLSVRERNRSGGRQDTWKRKLFTSISTVDDAQIVRVNDRASMSTSSGDVILSVNQSVATHVVNRHHSSSSSVSSEGSTSKPFSSSHMQRLHFGRRGKDSFKNRMVLVTRKHASPFVIFSLLPYTKNNSQSKDQRGPPASLGEIQLLETIQPDGGQDISYEHLLVPAKATLSLQSGKSVSTESSLGVSNEATQSSSPDVSVTTEEAAYNSTLLDDPELRSGKHRTLLTFSSYMTSVIDYARPADLKKELNEKFKEKFPHIQLTLSKLRSLKRDLKKIAYIKCGIDLWTVAQSYVYFEKIILKGLLTKPRRKLIASACLILSAKLNDTKGCELTKLIEEMEEYFKIHRRDMLTCEFAILVQLEFSLHIPDSDIYSHYQRLLYAS